MEENISNSMNKYYARKLHSEPLPCIHTSST